MKLTLLLTTLTLGGLQGCGAYLPCSEEYQSDPQLSADTTSELDGSPAPTFTWGNGNAAAVVVNDASGDNIWRLQCGGDNGSDPSSLESQACIPSPLVYGDVPESEYLDTVNTTAAEALQPASTYTILVDWWTASDDPSCASAHHGTFDFTMPQ